MKTINVSVIIQLDVQGDDVLNEVRDALELVNLGLQIDNPNSVQIFGHIDENDLLEPIVEFEIGDSVEAPEPNESDTYNHGGWIGTILDIRGELADVEDGDGDVFSIELERLTLEN